MNYLLRVLPKVFIEVAVVLLVTLLASCNDHTTYPQSRPQLLVSGDWVVTQWLYTNGNSPTVDFFTDTPACKRDDYFTFLSNGTFVQQEGLTDCSKSLPNISSASVVKGGWQVSSGQQTIMFTYTGQTLLSGSGQYQSYYFFPPECTVKQLDESTFIMQGIADQNGDGQPDTHLYTLKKR